MVTYSNRTGKHSKSDTRKKPSQSAINRLIFALQGIGHTVSLQPYNGRIMPVIVKVAA